MYLSSIYVFNKKIPKQKVSGFEAVKDISPTIWSGLRGSNSLPPPWQGGALPDELNPHYIKNISPAKNATSYSLWCFRSESNQRHGDFQSPALPTELQKHKEKENSDPDEARTHDLRRDRAAL